MSGALRVGYGDEPFLLGLASRKRRQSMSAFFTLLDIILAAVLLAWVWPALSHDTQGLALIIGLVVIAWRSSMRY
jgi:hypothetical protein